MQTLAIPTAVLLLALVACAPSQITTIENLGEPRVVKLVAPDPEKPVFSIEIKGTGSIDGTAQIELMLDGKPYKSQNLEGRVSFTWAGDWYSPTAELRYRPTKARGGELQLRYSFGT